MMNLKLFKATKVEDYQNNCKETNYNSKCVGQWLAGANRCIKCGRVL